MTVFILVAGAFTGGHVWEETARGLTGAGAEVHAVTLSGLGGDREAGDRRAGDPAVDLETHVADLVRLIDSVEEPLSGGHGEIVMVGHDYGIHPVLGAADRRAERIARIVYLDSGLPQDGVPALAAVPDATLREELAQRAQRVAREDGGGTAAGVLPAPAGAEQWQRWGSTEGMTDDALDRLTRLAAPQPLGTLLQPLRLTGAVAAVPFSGVLCTGNGVSIELVQRRVSLGDPALQVLADPGVGFFELATGHWPMLSCPGELAGVLLAAAAGEGHRLTSAAAEVPPHLRPFLLDVPDVPRERHGQVDLYLPPAAGADQPQVPRPAVVFLHGGPVPADARPTPRDWPAIMGYARLAAGRGVVGATVDHRLHDLTDHERAAEDIAAAVELVRADPRVDADRIALWFFSGGSLITADWLGAPPPWLRCLAATYPVLAPLPNWGMADSRFHPVRAVRKAGGLPIVLTRVGREMPPIAATVEEFLAAAEDCAASVEVVDAPQAEHGFETLDPTDASREAVRRALDLVLDHLRGQGQPGGSRRGPRPFRP
ncbi:alpha/beta fold hydrolase [Streptomyces bambusae]|uniref:Alpha/beta hydrolase n=1 Tax=Streptomyces bambusae TaxID=1550616 RepID=A0ABS6ZEN8_9ACTN|nr:alpha/beta fold hydrolase [Streptomyces bambusae]MBW5485889.1 alpha/beta hydrolase [Streptomyces bambusae]